MATVDSSFTVSSWPAGQAVASLAAAIGRFTSKVSPQARQRYSYRGTSVLRRVGAERKRSVTVHSNARRPLNAKTVTMLGRLLRKPLTWVVVAVLAVGGAFGLYWFQPWKLFTSVTVNETLPEAEAPTTAPATAPATAQATTPATGAPVKPAGNTLLRTGKLITHEHETSGDVQLIRLAGGEVQLVLRNLKTSDGPDVRVWLTDRPVAPDEWDTFDDGRWVELGRLKGNVGNQVYAVPAGTDLAGLRSVSLWCKRFSVSFGAAELRAV